MCLELRSDTENLNLEKEFRRLLDSGASGLVLNDFLALHENNFLHRLDNVIKKMSEISSVSSDQTAPTSSLGNPSVSDDSSS